MNERLTKKRAPSRKVITEEQGAAILAQREELALEEIRALGGRIGLYEARRFEPGDPLRGTEDRWLLGTAYITFVSTQGKTKTFSEASAVAALDSINSWLGFNDRMKPEFQFQIVPNGQDPEPLVTQRIGSEEARRRAGQPQPRVVSFDGGTPHLVDARGDALSSEANAQASAHRA